MFGQYWIIAVNGIVALLILFGFLLYRFFYPKKSINYPLLLGIVSLLPCISIFRPGAYESGDFVYHIYRAMAFADSLRDGILIPSWAGSLNSGYGYPVFLFIYNIPYYVISFLHFSGLTYIFSEKVLLASAFIGSGFLMYALLYKLTKHALGAFVGSVIYLYSPYHLVDMHFRVSIAEHIGFVLAPALLYLMLKIEESKKIIYVLLAGLLFGIFLLDHPAQIIFYFGLFFAYMLYKQLFLKKKSVRLFISLVGLLIIGFAISSYALVARLTLTRFTRGSLLLKTPVSFVRPQELLFSPWRFGLLFQGHHGELSYAIGYTQILLMLFALYFLFKKRKTLIKYKELLFWTGISLVIIFCMLPYSSFLWKTIPLLNLMQFSYRLLHPLVFCLSYIAAYLISTYNNKKTAIFIFVVATIGYTILNWGNRGMIARINDKWISDHLLYTAQGEAMQEGIPIWWQQAYTADPTKNVPKQHIDILQGQAVVKQIKRTTTEHTYIIYATNDATILENTFYFPGWTVRIDGKPTGITYRDPRYNARIIFIVSKGLHLVELQYTDIPPLQYAKTISVTVTLLIVVYVLIYGLQYIPKLP